MHTAHLTQISCVHVTVSFLSSIYAIPSLSEECIALRDSQMEMGSFQGLGGVACRMVHDIECSGGRVQNGVEHILYFLSLHFLSFLGEEDEDDGRRKKENP